MKNAEPQLNSEIMKTAKINLMCQTGRLLCANLHTPPVEGGRGRSQEETGGFKLALGTGAAIATASRKSENAQLCWHWCAFSVCVCATFLWTIDLSCCCWGAGSFSTIISAPTERLASANVESRRRNFQGGRGVGGFGE